MSEDQSNKADENAQLYWCPVGGWVKPEVWGGTFLEGPEWPQYICPGCGETLHSDPFGYKDLENGRE